MAYIESTLRKTSTAHRYLLCYAAIVAITWNAAGLWWFFQMSHAKGNQPVMPIWLLVQIPFVLPAIFLVLNAMSFPFRYSAFGHLQRSPWPDTQPLASSRNIGGKIASVAGTAPFFSWYLFSDGIGLISHPWSKAFVPFSHVDSISTGILGGKTISHHWGEVRSPLVIPRSAVAKQIDDALQAFRNAKP